MRRGCDTARFNFETQLLAWRSFSSDFLLRRRGHHGGWRELRECGQGSEKTALILKEKKKQTLNREKGFGSAALSGLSALCLCCVVSLFPHPVYFPPLTL